MNVTITGDNVFEGIWIQEGKDDVHIHVAKLDVGGVGIVLGHNVDQCQKDKASRHAVAIVRGKPIMVQHVNPETGSIDQKEISPETFYAKFKDFLASL